LFRVAQYDQIRVFVDVPEALSTKLLVGASAQITPHTLPDRTFEGKVTRTGKSIDARTCGLRVEVDVPNKDLAVIPGAHVHVKLQVAPVAVVQVPASAVLFQSASPQVAVVDSNGPVRLQDVSVARINGNFVEIASGLSEGDKVAVNISKGIDQVVDTNKVTAEQIAMLPGRQPVSRELTRAVWEGVERRITLSARGDSSRVAEIQDAEAGWPTLECAGH
jgi:RND family efflux transporter MFP subunit